MTRQPRCGVRVAVANNALDESKPSSPRFVTRDDESAAFISGSFTTHVQVRLAPRATVVVRKVRSCAVCTHFNQLTADPGRFRLMRPYIQCMLVLLGTCHGHGTTVNACPQHCTVHVGLLPLPLLQISLRCLRLEDTQHGLHQESSRSPRAKDQVVATLAVAIFVLRVRCTDVMRLVLIEAVFLSPRKVLKMSPIFVSPLVVLGLVVLRA